MKRVALLLGTVLAVIADNTCEDLLKAGSAKCLELKSEGKCAKKEYVQKMCMKTCGLCQPTSEPTSGASSAACAVPGCTSTAQCRGAPSASRMRG